MIKATGLCHEFPGVEPVSVLRGATLNVGPGESVAIMGPSGSGKSTLLAILAGLERPQAGHVEVAGKPMDASHAAASAALRRTQLGVVFQEALLLPQCSVWENVQVPLLGASGEARDAAEERLRGLLERVGLADRLDHFPHEMSVGQRQRVAVVRALANRPVALLADEPTGALDRTQSDELVRVLVSLQREEDVALVVATHAPEVAAQFDRVLVLDGGVLTLGGGPS